MVLIIPIRSARTDVHSDGLIAILRVEIIKRFVVRMLLGTQVWVRQIWIVRILIIHRSTILRVWITIKRLCEHRRHREYWRYDENTCEGKHADMGRQRDLHTKEG